MSAGKREDARTIAYKALGAFRREGAWNDLYLKTAIERAGLDKRDAGFATRLSYVTLQNIYLCDHVIGMYSRTPLNKLEPRVLDLLRTGAAQLMFMNSVPASAAVNESVRIAKSINPGAAKFVNAVLRALSSSPIPEVTGDDESERLSVTFSHPLWLVKEYMLTHTPEDTRAWLAANNAVPPVTVHTNTVKTTTEKLRASLVSDGVQTADHPTLPDCLDLTETGDLQKLAAFREGWMIIADAAARMAVMAASPMEGERVLDTCAAPGGKTFLTAVAMKCQGSILACDIRDNKLAELIRSARRLGLGCIDTRTADGTVFLPELESRFDLVIADVPCSGFGVIRKKPDIRCKDRDKIAHLPELQSAILANVSRYVREGGRLLYATCTHREQENGEVVRGFLAGSPAFRLGHGEKTLAPHIDGTDGFYFALMERTSDGR